MATTNIWRITTYKVMGGEPRLIQEHYQKLSRAGAEALAELVAEQLQGDVEERCGGVLDVLGDCRGVMTTVLISPVSTYPSEGIVGLCIS